MRIFFLSAILIILIFLILSIPNKKPQQLPEKPNPIQILEVRSHIQKQKTYTEKVESYIESKYPYQSEWILVSVPDQTLFLVNNMKIHATYPISTSEKGVGNRKHSDQTPLGLHEIKEKIGDKLPENAILNGRVYIGQQAEILSEPIDIDLDVVTSRIMWLSGLEEGFNKGGNVDSYDRFIYIHGTKEEGLIGTPASHGCIRMYNEDVIELFNKISIGTSVLIINDNF